MFFKKKENETEKNFLIKICALLIHTAKIDENYTDNEEEIIKKTLLELGVKKEDLSSTIKDAKILEEAGCFGIVLEKIPRDLAKRVSESVNIPTIGIGAGPDCDGQVLVLHDLLGITMDFSPRFLRRYLNLADDIHGAITNYCEDVRSGEFPSEDESYTS